jgi:hypothetical protein
MDGMNPGKNFAYSATELTDREITRVFEVVEQVRANYAGKVNSPENLEALRDEALTRLMEINIIATLDPSPCFYGEPPVLEIVGKVHGDPLHQHGFDHEQKGWEVNKSRERGEDWLGQQGNVDKRKRNKPEVKLDKTDSVDELRSKTTVDPVKKTKE